ncbi:hypothetical protein HYU16_00430 [Candidatus Woesearchaeota archaeon]|nr:hypothetical protein [Candidatus Woesearchaeota archaeon]
MVYNPSGGRTYKAAMGAAVALSDYAAYYNAALMRHLPGMGWGKPSPLEDSVARTLKEWGQKQKPQMIYVATQMRIPFHRGITREGATPRARPAPKTAQRTPRNHYRKRAEPHR